MSTPNGSTNGATRHQDGKVRVAIIGVGNCASSFVQGVRYYRDADARKSVPGLMHVDLGGYHVRDIEFTAAFDIDVDKVGKDLSEAIFAGQNNTLKFADNVPHLGVPVQRGMTHDGLGKYLKEKITKAPGPTADITDILKETRTDVVVSYLPVGSEDATKWYVEQILDAGCAFVNCIPVFIAREEYWNKRFKKVGLPIVGDDIKSQVGATIVHRALARLFHERGVQLQHTSQLNVGGNMDFYNMLERERLESKKTSKTNAVTSIMGHELPADDVHVGPSDYVPWLTDRKWAHIRLEGQAFGDVPLQPGAQARGVGLAELRRDRDRRRALLQAGARQRDLRPARRPQLLPDEVADEPATRRRGARSDREVHRQVRAPGDRPEAREAREVEGPLELKTQGPRQRPHQGNRLPAVPSERLAIAQVTPFAWEVAHEVNDYVARVSGELARRGHRVLIIAPSQSGALVRDSRRAIRAGADSLLDQAEGEPLVLGVGEVLPFSPTLRRAASLPLDVARTIEDALVNLPLDIVHVHEPFAPSASSVALRHSRGLNVGSFHAPTERILSTQLTRPLSRLLFGRLDARTASYDATRDLLQRYFPGEYQVILPGAEVEPARDGHDRVRLLFCAGEERAALRVFLRALRSLAAEPGWRATVWSPRALAPPATLSRALRERVEFLDADRVSEADALAGADVLVLASEGLRPVPGTLVRALAGGVLPVASRLRAYEELLGQGEYGFEFEPGDAQTLASHLRRVIAEPGLRERARARAPELRARFGWPRVTDELEQVYDRLIARRHDTRGNGAVTRAPALPAPDRRRPAHAHRPFLRLRHAGRGAAGRGRRAWAGGDRDHRPQRDLGRARSASPGRRHHGDRRRGGQDRRSGRGDRAVHRGQDPPRDDPPGDDRRDQAPGWPGVRAPSV